MAQKVIKYTSTIKRSVEQSSADRFIFFKVIITLLMLISLSLFSCGAPEIKLSRADRRIVDTLVNRQLDSISPILDSTCLADKNFIIQKMADSIMLERKKKEERLRLKK